MLLASFLEIPSDSHFPIQNLPFGIFSTKNTPPRVGVRIGDFILDLTVVEKYAFFGWHLQGKNIFAHATLNKFMKMGKPAWREARIVITNLLRAENPTLKNNRLLRGEALIPIESVTLHLPVDIGDYTDFYASRQHATNVGAMFRGPENALMPNWLHLPVGYHGRASSVILSGVDILRPHGQTRPAGAEMPVFGPSKRLDFELEMGYFIGPGNPPGEPVPVNQAGDHIFGMVLVNDWSARDIQAWEYQPLGPFLAKNFATSISPWVVPLDALEPFRVPNPVQDPEPLPYLRAENAGTYDIHLEASLQTEQMDTPQVICRSNFKHMYWNIYQQVAHHTITGCNLRPGDLIASGTISGPTPDSYGSMLELAWRGERPVQLSSGEARSFLQDGDRVTMTGWGEGDGYRVGFGEVTAKVLGTILPATSS